MMTDKLETSYEMASRQECVNLSGPVKFKKCDYNFACDADEDTDTEDEEPDHNWDSKPVQVLNSRFHVIPHQRTGYYE